MSSRKFPVQLIVFSYVLFFLFSSLQVLVWEYTDCSPDTQVLYGSNELLYSNLLPMGPVPKSEERIVSGYFTTVSFIERLSQGSQGVSVLANLSINSTTCWLHLLTADAADL